MSEAAAAALPALTPGEWQRVRGLMGLCVRAGQAVFGEEACLKAVRGGKGLLLMDLEASPATQDKYESACAHAGVPLMRLPGGTLYDATGRPGKAMFVQPGGLCSQLIAWLNR